ncbi:MAG: FixG Ig-like domain-containing protein, partial [Roseinatronobacter sp.]
FVLSTTENPDLSLSIEGEPATLVTVGPDEQALLRVYLTAPPDTPSNRADSSPVRIWATISGSNDRVYSDTVFNGRNQ